MADGVTYDMDTAAVVAALTSLGDAAQPLINEACRETAVAIAREAQARLQRQLAGTSTPTKSRPDLGQGLTVAGIVARPAYDGNGYVVVDERDPYPAVPLWLEKGTKQMAARPFFYVSALLEQDAHLRRISDAVQDAITVTGLGS